MKIQISILACCIYLGFGSIIEESVEFNDTQLDRPKKGIQEGFKGPCVVAEFDTVQNVELRKLDGDWFEVFRTHTSVLFQSGIWRFQSTKTKDVNFIFGAKLLNDKCMPPIDGHASVSESSPSSIVMYYSGLKGIIEEEYKVIETDYKHRTVLYACRHVRPDGKCSPHASVLVILTKHRSLAQHVLDNMKGVAKNVCIQPDALIQQQNIGACNLDQLDMDHWSASHPNTGTACTETSPCTVTCPACCTEQDDGCIRCQCEDEVHEVMEHGGKSETQPFKQPDEDKPDEDCVLALTDCPGTNCRLAEKRSGCFVCDCGVSLRAPPVLQNPLKTFGISDIRNCPTTCRTMHDSGKLMCDCSNKELCQPIPPNVPLSCPSKKERYYFDDRTGTCHAFYGSCLPDINNFKTLKECIDSCADICELSPEPGRCRVEKESSRSLRYYFNKVRGVCDIFSYSGCGGNANNFETEALCKHQCPEWTEKAESSPRPDRCYLNSKKGNCQESHIRYFYLNVTRTCTSFFYSGCDKNENNFDTLDECRKVCIEKQQVAPKQCPDISECKCRPVQGEDECFQCPCDPDSAVSLHDSAVLALLVFSALISARKHL